MRSANGATVHAGMHLPRLGACTSAVRSVQLRSCLTTAVQQKSQPQSTYVGVHWHSGAAKWAAAIRDPFKGKRHLGIFDSEKEAAQAFDAAVYTSRGPYAHRNFSRSIPAKHDLDQMQEILQEPKRKTSAYTGVSRKGAKWQVHLTLSDGLQTTRQFDNEEAAAQFYDEFLRSASVHRSKLLAKLNFLQPCDFFSEDTWEDEPIPEGKSSRFLGVSGMRNKYRARTLGKSKHLGMFTTELEAARAFDAAAVATNGRTNFRPPIFEAAWSMRLV